MDDLLSFTSVFVVLDQFDELYDASSVVQVAFVIYPGTMQIAFLLGQ